MKVVRHSTDDLFLFVPMSISIIITAGGIGKRMGDHLPKQFLSIRQEPILLRTLKAFASVLTEAEIILTLPQDWHQHWYQICRDFQFLHEHITIDGGKERFDSVRNALLIAKGEKVLVHDGVRPFVSSETIHQVLQAINTKEGAIPVLPSVDSLRMEQNGSNKSVDRTLYKRVQTPQGFVLDELKEAYLAEYKEQFTDDASVYEAWGGKIKMVPGNTENIKITEPIDLKIAELFVK